MKRKPIKCEFVESDDLVQVDGQTIRCAGPLCGDKIKNSDYYLVTFDDGNVCYVDPSCMYEFVNGHPDSNLPGVGPIAGYR